MEGLAKLQEKKLLIILIEKKFAILTVTLLDLLKGIIVRLRNFYAFTFFDTCYS